MVLMALRKGGVKCSSACPFYEPDGVVRGFNGPLKTHCRATMQTVIVDCDVWNPYTIEKMQVSEEEWQRMQELVHKHAIRERKPYPDDHDEIHAVGYHWSHEKGKWNADKSAINI